MLVTFFDAYLFCDAEYTEFVKASQRHVDQFPYGAVFVSNETQFPQYEYITSLTFCPFFLINISITESEICYLMFQIRNQSSSLLLFMERKKEASS